MSLRTTLLPSLLHLHPAAPPKAAKRLFHWLPNQPGTIIHPSPRSIPTQPIAITRSKTAQPRQSRVPIYTTLGLALGLTAYSAFTKPKIACAAYAGYPNDLTNTPPQPAVTGGESLPNESILSVYQLGFGTVAGICTGVFLKKGLRAIAFLLGGVFVFLQVSFLPPFSLFLVYVRQIRASADEGSI